MMGEFIVYPAIDLRDGQVVRLKQGKGDRQTVYGDAPEQTAQEWVRQGAKWLHIVNLNGALGEGTAQNEEAIKTIVGAVGDEVNIQLGGGIRSLEQIEAALALGVSRVVLGTAVIENPDFGVEVLGAIEGERIAFGFDALGDELMSRGWQTASGRSMQSLAETLAEAGAKTLIYTNILKDGMETGVDWEKTQKLAEQTGLEVIASGGVAALNDIAYVRWAGLAGVIVGRALYEGNFTLKEALNVR
ncbi:MAG TPA: 1-(5-phosphoribosyl)-5-[(5-phosphoribosylamino)methylideneamino]imidazole-4-carboxamide isomerase [Anaerolineales bacterium]|nr:1-(5-phosphoribosyl)-5-[(5-phosphoribosylamino)methylideneamino]imidazole-4-carboxamide isomerase [Anaerolineales bacterium]